jgi:hypothetical protein
MNNIEGLCKWHFDKQTGEDQGPGDALGQNFQGEPYAALVRESIQNSLDVPYTLPVKVVYSFGKLDSSRFPNFFELKQHIKGCMDFWKAKKDIVAKYKAKLECFDNKFTESMPYLKVSDYKTTGMDYIEGDNNCPFYAFVRASKISVKGGSFQGGTYGFGKAAYFQLSPINTLFISTKTSQGKVFFEGKSVLCTHTYEGEKKTSVGFYDNHDGNRPIDIVKDIPEEFQRNEPGTDFYILGFTPSNMDDAIKKMTLEVLRSFHPAVLAGMLEVVIRPLAGEVIHINKATIENHLIRFFPDEQDTSGQFRTLNPRPYYDALVHEGKGNGYELIERKKEHLGTLKMFIKKSPGATDKIIYMRRPRMVVSSQKTQSSLGFYGVLVCDDIQGDELLSKLENSSHSKWNKDFYRDEITNDYIQDGVDAMNELKEFRDECIEIIASQNPNNELSISGLSDLLYVPDSLIEEDANHRQTVLGQPAGTTDEENGSITTVSKKGIETDDINLKMPESIGTILIDEPGKAINIGLGTKRIGIGHSKGHGNGEQNPASGSDIDLADIAEANTKHFVPMNVPIRVFAQTENGIVYHMIVIHSDRIVGNGKLELVVCGEQFDMQIKIVETNNGIASDNTITNLILRNATERIKIRFADNLKHTVQTKLYYEE